MASKILDWEGTTIDFVDSALSFYGHGFKLHSEKRDTGDYDVEIEKEDVYVTFTLTTPACPIGPQVSEQMKEFVGDLPGVTAVRPYTEPDHPGQLLVTTAGSGADLRAEISRAASAAGAPLLEMTRYAPLEEVFRHLTHFKAGPRDAAATQPGEAR